MSLQVTEAVDTAKNILTIEDVPIIGLFLLIIFGLILTIFYLAKLIREKDKELKDVREILIKFGEVKEDTESSVEKVLQRLIDKIDIVLMRK